MSGTQGVKPSVGDEVVVVEEAEKKLILTNHDDQHHTTVALPAAVVAEAAAAEAKDHVMQDNVLSSETMQKVLDAGKLLNIDTNETTDRTVTAKRDQVIEKSVSGECRNILPVLVQHLRSALELSAINQNPSIMDEPLAPNGLTTKPSLCHSNSQHTNEDSTKSQPTLLNPMDLNFFEDLLLADIKTALMRLQDMLRRVDVDALNRYSSSLEPNDKLHLLQMISSLVTNLRMVKMEDAPPHSKESTNKIKQHHSRGRNRHTIGVSSEELARARKWLEERGPSINSPVTLSSRSSVLIEPDSMIIPQRENTNTPANDNAREQTFDSARACDKHIKDAINQQQSLQSRSRDMEDSSSIVTAHDSKGTVDISNSSRFDETTDTSIDYSTTPTTAFIVKSCNKFTAKKSKIKRANTIDIPNYLKLQAENNKQSSSPGLRRPIDISDRLSWNPPQIVNMTIPSFEPKTENDRKFLALINRNNDTNGNGSSGSNSPFKSFNYRQTSSIADKNWKNRFSNIKTTFDKSPTSASLNGELLRKNSRDDNKPPSKHYSKERDKESAGVTVSSLKQSMSTEVPFVSQNDFSPRKFPIFTHAASSPFQKIQTCPKNISYQTNPISPSTYLPACASGGMLRAKVKMFDHQERTENPPPRVKPESLRVNVFTNSEKIQPDPSVNHTQQIIMRNHNSNLNRLFNDGYTRRNTLYRDDMAEMNKRERDVGRRQSVAVQTINYPIEMSKHVGNMDRRDSFAISRPSSSDSNQQIYQSQLPQSPLSSVPSSSLPSPSPPPLPPLPSVLLKTCYSENDNPLYVPPEKASIDSRALTFNNSPLVVTDRIAKNYSNCDSYSDQNIYSSNNNNNNHKNMEDDVFTTEDHSFIEDENIENQDISNDGIVTRYTSAIVTLEKSPSPPQTFSPIGLSNYTYEQSIASTRPSFPSTDHVQRHNMLQQNLIRQLQRQDDKPQRLSKIMEPSQRYTTTRFEQEYNPPPFDPLPVPRQSIEADNESCGSLIESNNTQEKINLFEGKLVGANECRTERPVPLMPLRVWPVVSDRPTPKINITSPPSTSWPHVQDCSLNIHPSSIPFKYQTGPGDSSDEYLVSCASQPHRSIVLSKSESWHQLAMSKSHLQVPQQTLQQPQYKLPPKITSHSAKHLGSTSSDKLKKMEEKVQRYFHNGCGDSNMKQMRTESNKQVSRRSFSPRKNHGTLARSQTMPHIYDELTDIDKQFDSLFEEATHDNRH